ncbi:Peptidase C2, calpain, catalytic domain [Plasmopara halstedii]|uniref:Peptidase C2, calpain, catalytic domain n=1 Tax=Plasmopara halstedii TaxID=4781 RepID=A0A0P1A8N5_PLAHL|nr:Peptidase C2, calpain, catalytic domain [Plasmopara halstedii]CEG36919.1 Peptidase C2, calpain, catalytic domain [Plasmopara halstedii]|eukprot:XP_024573288.1 Peptidase C2, calpain, catalytic domain [Plasmopara halstedii]
MQTLNDNLTIFVTQRKLRMQSAKPDETSTWTDALQYIGDNLGFETVKFRIDFSKSSSINIHRPAKNNSTDILPRTTENLEFTCELCPFERQTLAYVTKKGKNRALVHVQYEVLEEKAFSVNAILEARDKDAQQIVQQLQHSDGVFSLVNDWTAISSQSKVIIFRACDEINRFYQLGGDLFVDATFPPQAKSLYNLDVLLSEVDLAIYAQSTWEHLHSISNSSWTFVTRPNEVSIPIKFKCGLPAQDSFLCALAIIAPHCEVWLHRWFPTLDSFCQFENMAVVPVALCDRGLTWQHLLVDLFFPSFPIGRGLMTARNVLGELYPALLHKAYAKLKGSYAALSSIPTINILEEITGIPWTCCYRRATVKCCDDSIVGQAQLEEAINAVLCYQRPMSGKDFFLVVVTCGKVDNHQGAFQLAISSEETSRLTSVILYDVFKKLLHHQGIETFASFDRVSSPTSIKLSWKQLFELEPNVWSLCLDRQHEQRLRQVFHHDEESVKLMAAFSVSTLTTIAFSFSYAPRFPNEPYDQQVELNVSIARVENDFVLTPIEDIGNGFQDLNDGPNSILRKQVVRSLSAGEYVVTVTAKRLSGINSASKADELNLACPRTVLTSASADINLQLVFDCLDIQGKRELSERDICRFLQLYEHVNPLQYENSSLGQFLERFGRPGSTGWILSRDDFRNVYFSLAVKSCHELKANDSGYKKTISDFDIRARFQKLIWDDVVRLMSSSRWGVQYDRNDEDFPLEIKGREIVEVVCSFHSNTPLLDVVLLPSDKSFADFTSHNI